MSSKLELALALAALGFAVFPCEKNGKKPVVEWRDLSSTRKKDIIAWWGESNTDYNIGIDCFKSGLTVVDIDVKGGKQGRESYERLQKEHGLPDTFTVKTPSGGIHLYYRGSGYRNSVEKLAPGLDIRSDGGYVVAPGSVIGDVPYEIKRNVPAVDLPLWLKDQLLKFKNDRRDPGDKKKKKIIHKADAIDIDWAKDYLADREPAVEGACGDHHTFATICALKDRGIHPTVALELIEEYWNPYCCPPWDLDDLKTKIDNAYQYGTKEIGAGSALAVFDLPPASSQAPVPCRFKTEAFWPCLPHEMELRDRIFGSMWLAGQVSMLISQPGVGKSTWILEAAVSKTLGIDLLDIDPRGAGSVAVFNNEDDEKEQMRRIIACLDFFGIPRDKLREGVDKDGDPIRLYINGCENPCRVAKRLTDGNLKAWCNDIIEYLVSRKIRLAIFDPYSMTHPGVENSNEEALIIGSIYKHIALKANCAIVLVHHTRKLSGASSEGHSGNQDSARGASALMGIVRSAHTLDNISRQEAKRLGISDDHRRKYIMLEQAKSNMSAPDEYRKIYERKGHIIGRTLDNETGEDIGVIVPVNMKTLVAQATPELHSLIQDIEMLVEDGEMTIPAIARSLTNGSFPFHTGKQPDALTKTMQRMFSEGTLTGFKGVLHLEEREGDGRKRRFISLRRPAARINLDDLI